MPSQAYLKNHPTTKPASSDGNRLIRVSPTQLNHNQNAATLQVKTACRPLFNQDIWIAIQRSLKLSDREGQIMQLVFDDQKESSMASGLGISRHTVNTYLQRLYQKLDVSSRVQLIVRVVAEYMTLASQGQLPPY